MIIYAKKAWKNTLAIRTTSAVKLRINKLILEAIKEGNTRVAFETKLETKEEDDIICKYLVEIGYSVTRSKVGIIEISWYKAGEEEL